MLPLNLLWIAAILILRADSDSNIDLNEDIDDESPRISSAGAVQSPCVYIFSFQFMKFQCSGKKSIPKIENDQGLLICPKIYPYLHVLVNDHLQATHLYDAERDGQFFFGPVSAPFSATPRKARASIRNYFQTNLDMMLNSDGTLDQNRVIDEMDTLVLDWEADFEDNGTYTQRGDLTCSNAASESAEMISAGAVPLPCTWDGYTPGFWNTQTHLFVPNSCIYSKPSWPRPAAQRGPVWLHLFGDSNMNILYGQLCGRIGSRTKFRGERFPGNVIWSACISADGSAAIVQSVSWMSGGKASHLHLLPPVLGQTMASFLCYAKTLPGPPADPADCARWNVTAEWTVALSGSHNPELLIPHAADAVRSWVDDISARLPRPETLALALAGGVCIQHMAGSPRSRSQAFQRNSYRMRAVNDAAVAVARERGLPVLDFFTVTLAAGCGRESRDAVHFQGAVYRSESIAFFGWL
jgi:hypothetical protein